MDFHCRKSVQIWSYLWSEFFCIRTECGEIRQSLAIAPEHNRTSQWVEKKGIKLVISLISLE